MNVLLSIKPEFSEAILTGNKQYEFRRTIFSEPEEIDRVYIYTTSPVQKITGYFNFEKVVEDTPEQLWDQFGEVSGIDERGKFLDYYEGTDFGYAIEVLDPTRFDSAVDPRDYIKDFHPPVSFRYIREKLAELLGRLV